MHLQKNYSREILPEYAFLTVRKEGDLLIMDFPQLTFELAECPDRFIDALGITPAAVYMDSKRYLIEVDDPDALIKMEPDFNILAEEKYGFMITSKSDKKEYDFLSRFFAPCLGINEDPVTGSAHCYLAPYWAGISIKIAVFFKLPLDSHNPAMVFVDTG